MSEGVRVIQEFTN